VIHPQVATVTNGAKIGLNFEFKTGWQKQICNEKENETISFFISLLIAQQ
jgi:hypothetical protein